jgi:hypothetical protein
MPTPTSSSVCYMARCIRVAVHQRCAMTRKDSALEAVDVLFYNRYVACHVCSEAVTILALGASCCGPKAMRQTQRLRNRDRGHRNECRPRRDTQSRKASR